MAKIRLLVELDYCDDDPVWWDNPLYREMHREILDSAGEYLGAVKVLAVDPPDTRQALLGLAAHWEEEARLGKWGHWTEDDVREFANGTGGGSDVARRRVSR